MKKIYASKFSAGVVVQGDIQCMNRTVGPFMHRLSGFVHQEDLFDGTLTVLEHLTFVVCKITAPHRRTRR